MLAAIVTSSCMLIGSAVVIELVRVVDEPVEARGAEAEPSARGAKRGSTSKKKSKSKARDDKKRSEQKTAGSKDRSQGERAKKRSKRSGASKKSSIPRERTDREVEKVTVAKGDGWIPAGATQVREVNAWPDAARSRSHCEEIRSPISMGKEVGGLFDEVFRENSSMMLSDKEEAALGDEILAEIRAGRVPQLAGKFDLPADRRKYGRYVQGLVDRLVRYQSRELDYRVFIVRDSSFNAFAMPGGVMGVHTGLLSGPNSVKSEAELVAVLAHEIAHIDKRHVSAEYAVLKQTLGRAVGPAQIVAQLLTRPISTERELEADRRGIDFTIKAQYDPVSAAELWERMARKYGGSGGRGDLFATHPPSAKRCYKLEARIARAKKSAKHTVYYVGESNLSKRTPGYKKAY